MDSVCVCCHDVRTLSAARLETNGHGKGACDKRQTDWTQACTPQTCTSSQQMMMLPRPSKLHLAALASLPSLPRSRATARA